MPISAALGLLFDGDFRWMDAAACVAHPAVDWFAPDHDRVMARAAVAVCDDCPCRLACLAFALSNQITDGTWGGMEGWQRQGREACSSCWDGPAGASGRCKPCAARVLGHRLRAGQPEGEVGVTVGSHGAVTVGVRGSR
jgi:hypothetical protein